MYSLWVSLQPYSYSNFGGVMIPQMPVNYAQNAYAYQVRTHTHTQPLTPISQQHPVQGLPGTAHMLLHMRWRVQPGLDPPVPAQHCTAHIPLAVEVGLGFFYCSVWWLTPLPRHAVHSTSLDGGPEDTACQSGDSAFSGNMNNISVITARFEAMEDTC